MMIKDRYNLFHINYLKWLIALCMLLLVVDVLVFNHLLELRAEEPRRAVVSFEMLQTGDWIVPHLHHEVYYNKPPFFNWIQAGSMFLFGSNEWAVRLPGALSFLGLGWMVYIFLRKVAHLSIALLGALAFFTSADLLFYGSINTGEIDLFYSLIVVLQAWVIYKYHQSEQYFWLFTLSYLLVTIGFMTKGIPSLAFQALTLLVYFIWTGRFSKLLSWQHFLGIFLFVGLTALYLFAYDKNGDALGFLVRQFKETSQRSANEFGLTDILLQLINFPVMMITKLMPWSLLGFLYFYRPVRQQVWATPILKFSLIFILSNILIYWISPDVRVRYIYMFFPFLIVLLMAPLQMINWETANLRKVFTIPTSIALFLIPLGFLIGAFVLEYLSIATIITLILLGIVGLYVGVVNFRLPASLHQTWSVALILLIARLGYNVAVLPHLPNYDQGLMYRSLSNDLLQQADGRPIYLTGPQEVIHSDVTLLGKNYYDVYLKIPPTIPYQIPYYYSLSRDETMMYQQIPMDHSACYLLFADHLTDTANKRILYEFVAPNNQQKLLLFEWVLDQP